MAIASILASTLNPFLCLREPPSPRSRSVVLSRYLESCGRRWIPRSIRACQPPDKLGGDGGIAPSAKILHFGKDLLSFASDNFLPLALVSGVGLGFANPTLGCLADKYSFTKISTCGIFIIAELTLRTEAIGAAIKGWPLGVYGLCLGIMLPERRSTVVSSYLNPCGHNDNSFLLLRRGKKFGRIVKLKLSHFFLFFVSLFFFSCIFSGHKLLFHGSEFLPHFEQNPYMKSHMLVSSEIDIGSNKSNIEKPPGSKKRNKHLPCEVALAESVDRILEPQDYLNFTRFSLGFVETETYNEPRFGGHQTLKERERSYSAINQTIHCGFVKGTNGFNQGTGFDLSEMDRAYMKNCVVSVSSCIFGSSDFLRRPASKKISEFSKRNVCFVMFVDEQTLSKLASEGHVPDKQGFVGLWKTVVVSNLPYTDMRKTGKVPKFLSHRLFPSSRYSIWIDSKMRLTTDPMLIIDFFLWRTKSEFAISNHYDRHCVWDEVLQNKRLNKYNHSAIDEQFMFYRSDGLKKFDPSDPNTPLPSYVPEGSFIVRAHTPMSNLFTCLWFNEVNRFTSRDQLSFAYTYLKLQRLNPDRPLRLNMFKDCERRALTKLFHHRVDSSPPSPLA